MLETLAIALVMLWLLGMTSADTFHGFMHLLLAAAIIVAPVRMMREHRATI